MALETEGIGMTILDNHRVAARPVSGAAPLGFPAERFRRPVHRAPAARPAVAPLRHRGTGVAMSVAPHRPARHAGGVSTPVTLALAVGAALLTVWLGLLAHAGTNNGSTSPVLPERLAVVQVQAGETLQELAARVAPDAPAGAMAERIRDLNELASSAVEAGQTLISPVG